MWPLLQVNSALHPSGVAESSTSFGWGKGGSVTSAGWQVTLCDPMWHVSSRSGVATLRTAIHLLLMSVCDCLVVQTAACHGPVVPCRPRRRRHHPLLLVLLLLLMSGRRASPVQTACSVLTGPASAASLDRPTASPPPDLAPSSLTVPVSHHYCYSRLAASFPGQPG